jgi:hypothetical protein
MKVITFKEDYFSVPLKWIGAAVGIVIVVIGILYLQNWAIALAVPVVVMLFTTYNEIEIDVVKGTIKDSFLFFWIPTSEEILQFKSLIKIRIDKQRQGYTANSRARTAQVKFNEYVGVLEFDSGELEILRSVNFEEFSVSVRDLASKLDIPVDRTF